MYLRRWWRPHGPCSWASQSPGRWRRRAKQGNFGLGAERPAFWLQPCSQRFLFASTATNRGCR